MDQWVNKRELMILNLKDSFFTNRKPYNFLLILCHDSLKAGKKTAKNNNKKKPSPSLPLSDNSVELQGVTLVRTCLRL
ncbi:hypothetical protein ACRRTK_021061 [Alexandromys fortis]